MLQSVSYVMLQVYAMELSCFHSVAVLGSELERLVSAHWAGACLNVLIAGGGAWSGCGGGRLGGRRRQRCRAAAFCWCVHGVCRS